MEVRGLKAEVPFEAPLPAGTFAWATVHDYTGAEHGRAKAVALSEHTLFTATRKGIRKYSTTDGRCGNAYGNIAQLMEGAETHRCLHDDSLDCIGVLQVRSFYQNR
jgi:hypothetical protein